MSESGADIAKFCDRVNCHAIATDESAAGCWCNREEGGPGPLVLGYFVAMGDKQVKGQEEPEDMDCDHGGSPGVSSCYLCAPSGQERHCAACYEMAEGESCPDCSEGFPASSSLEEKQ